MKRFIFILTLLGLGFVIVSYLRPNLFVNYFFDFGLISSTPGFIAFVITSTLLIGEHLSYFESKFRLKLILFVYLGQEIFSGIFPFVIGTFDFLDIAYYFLGYILSYRLYVFSKNNKLSIV